ncbi:MAG: tRNA (adenosine(37)-N6)-threonylcarbamoyltransferase complex dimerization subunit type 1 TsaB [Wenzhouxiangella sp.]
MNILAIETATDFCSVALDTGGEILARERLAPRQHAELVVPWSNELLAEAGLGWSDIDGFAVSRGPGGFTSLRIGLSLVQGMALVGDRPVHPVGTLEVLARAAWTGETEEWILALLDARMGEVYSGWYRCSPAGIVPIDRERVQPPQSLSVPEAAPWIAAGSGLAAWPEEVASSTGLGLADGRPDVWPDARSLLALATGVEPVAAWGLEPIYVRDRVTG